MAGEDTEETSAHDVDGAATAIACGIERTFAEECCPSSARVQELKEEDPLALASHGRLIVPLGIKASARGVQRLASSWVIRGSFSLTLWVS
jgi:hypothetical protein